MIEADVEATLARAAALLAGANGPWWIVGSAAVALYGVADVAVHDVDVLIDPADVPDVARRIGEAPRAGTPSDRFRSRWLLTVGDAPLSIELFADWAVRRGAAWRRIVPRTREPVAVSGHRLYVPAAVELIAMLERFDRPKDRARAAALRATAAGPGSDDEGAWRS